MRRPARLGVPDVHLREVVVLGALHVGLVVKEVAADIGHGSLDVLLGGRLGWPVKLDRLSRLVASTLPRWRRKEIFVVDLVCVQVSRLILGVLIHALLIALAFGRVEGHVAKRRAVLLVIVIIIIAELVVSRLSC